MRSKTDTFPCPVCSEVLRAKLVERVDADSDGESLALLLAGRLNRLLCPVCGHTGLAPEPVVVQSDTRRICAAFVPFSIPANRKAHVAGKFKALAQRVAGQYGHPHVCFGVRQLQEVLPWLPLIPNSTRGFQRFDAPGSAFHQVHALRRALKNRAGDVRLLARLGTALYASGDLKEARKTVEAVVREEPDNGDAWRCLGAILLDSGHAQPAADAFERAYRQHRDPECLFLAGVADFRAGAPLAALTRFQRVIQKRADFFNAYVWIAVVHTAEGRYGPAIEALHAAVMNGLKDAGMIRSRRELAPLFGERRFQSLMKHLEKQRARAPHPPPGTTRGAGSRPPSAKRSDRKTPTTLAQKRRQTARGK
ncbi:MAG TPA: tetratricopeptide repeat protein [Candidatus Latescibacteria bacterium]|nr:tetratricopeptide repeat protein [Candidatus Latescibacterota bacterium]